MRTPVADLLVPADLAELTTMLTDHPGACLVAGGTIALPGTHHLSHPAPVVCLTKRLRIDQVKPMSCGATATLATIACSRVPTALREAASSVAYPSVRNMATAGGNVAAGRPGCVAVALLALRASAWVLDASGGRQCVPVAAVVGESARPILGFEWPACERSGFGKLRASPGGGSTLASVAISLSDHRPGDATVAAYAGPHAPRILRRVQDAIASARHTNRAVLEPAVREDLRTHAESYHSHLLATLVDRLVRRLTSGREV